MNPNRLVAMTELEITPRFGSADVEATPLLEASSDPYSPVGRRRLYWPALLAAVMATAALVHSVDVWRPHHGGTSEATTVDADAVALEDTGPRGDYAVEVDGWFSKETLSVSVDATQRTYSLHATGSVVADCADDGYTVYSDLRLDLVGDAPCASAALKKAEMSLSSATYDSERDEIKIKMTYMTFLSRSFILEKAER